MAREEFEAEASPAWKPVIREFEWWWDTTK
jgi:hypothetical protein